MDARVCAHRVACYRFFRRRRRYELLHSSASTSAVQFDRNSESRSTKGKTYEAIVHFRPCSDTRVPMCNIGGGRREIIATTYVHDIVDLPTTKALINHVEYRNENHVEIIYYNGQSSTMSIAKTGWTNYTGTGQLADAAFRRPLGFSPTRCMIHRISRASI